jgi:hypothetical protein
VRSISRADRQQQRGKQGIGKAGFHGSAPRLGNAIDCFDRVGNWGRTCNEFDVQTLRT